MIDLKMEDLSRAGTDVCGGFHCCKDRTYDPAHEDCCECKEDADAAMQLAYEGIT